MLVKPALARQYDASLRMLKDCLEKCPEDLWLSGEERPVWKITYHTLFYTHLYMMQDMTKFKEWVNHREGAEDLHTKTDVPPYTVTELISYLEDLRILIPAQLESLDLESETSGFPWYNMPKFDHQLVNLRHIMDHVGQFSELLMQRGIDTNWFGGSLPQPT